MLHILGPVYKFNGETIQDEIIYIDDHHWDEKNQCYPVEELLAHNLGHHLLVFDHLGHNDALAKYQHVCMPVYLAAEVEHFINARINPNWNQRQVCFNFMINKPRPNREWLLRFVDEHHLRSRTHSLAWRESPFSSISVTDFKFGDENVLEKGIRNGSYANSETYVHLLKKTVFEPSCVSLITEPCWQERESMITEKTVMSIYSGTVPLWVGGWRLPDVMRELGFDVFDDLVDHSYSVLADPVERMKQSLQRNIDLLTNFDKVNDFVQTNWSRFAANLSLLEQNPFLQLVKHQIQKNPKLLCVADRWGLKV